VNFLFEPEQGRKVYEYVGPSYAFGSGWPDGICFGPTGFQLMWLGFLANFKSQDVLFRTNEGKELAFRADSIQPFMDRDGKTSWRIMSEQGPMHDPTGEPGHYRVEFRPSQQKGCFGIISHHLYESYKRNPD